MCWSTSATPGELLIVGLAVEELPYGLALVLSGEMARGVRRIEAAVDRRRPAEARARFEEARPVAASVGATNLCERIDAALASLSPRHA